jgi:hypothetical protein
VSISPTLSYPLEIMGVQGVTFSYNCVPRPIVW